MVISIQRWILVLALAAAPLVLCQCETQRTVLRTRPGSVSFADGGKAGDTAAIREKYADKGYKIGDDGLIKADSPNLYSGDRVRGVNKEFSKKEAKLGNTEARTKEFRTPEFIKRQEFQGVTEARLSEREARESNASAKVGRRLFGSRTKGTGDMSAYSTRRFEDSNKVFGTSENSAGAAALKDSPRATGSPAVMGYRDNAAMSFDDVKKMLNPGSYARNTGLTD